MSDYELLTEHFGYPPAALLDDVINTVNVLADRALDSVERLLLSLPPQRLGFTGQGDGGTDDGLSPEDAARREIESGTHQLETLLNASIDKNFDLFELYTMRNILTVRAEDRPHVRLAHYDGLDLPPPPDAPTPESVTALRRRLHASQRLHVALEAERARNDALLRKLRGALGVRDGDGDGDVKSEDGAQDAPPGPLAFLADKGTLAEGGSEQPIATTAEFALSQLPALRSLSASLRTILPDIDSAADDGDGDGDGDGENHPAAGRSRSWRRERAEYIESSSRKYLERARGLELGPRGEVRDGEWQGGGRGPTKGEVETLEKAAALLGSGSGSGSGNGGGGGGGGGDGGQSPQPAIGDGRDAMDE